MASGHARTESRRCGGPVHILDRNGRARWHDLWEGLDWIARPDQPAAGHVINGSGCRPYLNYPFTRDGGSHFSGWRTRDHIGALRLTEQEVEWAHRQVGHLGEFVLIEPTLAPEANPNKQWGENKWIALSEMLYRDFEIVQPLSEVGEALPNATGILCPNFRLATALIQRAAFSILPEGGLHHAAAALGSRAVVLFGGANSPEFTGYPMHMNLADDGPGSPCGAWLPCDHCRRIWERLTVATVYAAAERACAEERPVNGPEL